MWLSRLLSVPQVYSRFSRWSDKGGFREKYAREFVKPIRGMKVLDLGCGPGDALDYLGQVDYVGIDLSRVYIQRARSARGDRGRFEQMAIEGIRPGQFTGFDLVLATGVIHHLDDAAAMHLTAVASGALAPGGRFLSLDGVYYDRQPWLERFIISQDRGRHVRSPDAYLRICNAHFPKVVATKINGHLRIPYAIIIMEASGSYSAISNVADGACGEMSTAAPRYRAP